jgi:transcriptional activator SPT7
VMTFRKLFDKANNTLTLFLEQQHAASETTDGFVDAVEEQPQAEAASAPVTLKRPARVIDDDYDDSDDEEDESDAQKPEPPSLVKSASGASAGTSTPTAATLNGIAKPNGQPKSSDDARKQLEQDKRAKEEAAVDDFQSVFYTLEWDRAAMLEQQKVDELDRQVEAEVSGDAKNRTAIAAVNGAQQGYLSSANMGAHSLMLKHLLARIDSKRSMVRAQDWQLRKLISEVRKNRSKWASEEKVGQEELYEAAERVLQDLKAMTEHSGPFLNRVNKRDAPDYYNIIKHPMDIGTMMKKLKNFQYKSKKEFVDDLNLIWDNCLQYNTDPHHFLRKKALIMKKHTESLVFLIPDIVVRDRAEVEAEERRMQRLDADMDGEDSDDDKPIMHRSRTGGSKPSKGAKKGTTTGRKAPPSINEDSVDVKPLSAAGHRKDFLRADSDAPMEGIINGFSTPPPLGGTLTPIGLNGAMHSGTSQADASDADGPGFSVNDLSQQEDNEFVDLEFRTWKQVTKKARAHAAAERHRLFLHNKLNPEEPAVLRNKAGMRRFLRQQQKLLDPAGAKEATDEDLQEGKASNMSGQTLAEGVEAAEDDNILPDYYDPVSAIPDIEPRLRWEEDDEGYVISHAEECLRLVPQGHFTAPISKFGQRMNENIRQMQETRKVSAKITVVKQMQQQYQTYQNQFAKFDPPPLFEEDIKPHAVSDDGPIMAPDVCRAAFQRSIAKVFYAAGFEDFQPSALDVVTDMMGEYFQRLLRTFSEYIQAPKVLGDLESNDAESLKPRYTLEEALLHTLNENAVDLDSLETYVKDDVDRMSQKLAVMYERMTTHYKECLVSTSSCINAFANQSSDLHLTRPPVLKPILPLLMEATNSSAATLLKILTKISLVFANLDLNGNSVFQAYECHSIFFKTACVTCSSLPTEGMYSYSLLCTVLT